MMTRRIPPRRTAQASRGSQTPTTTLHTDDRAPQRTCSLDSERTSMQPRDQLRRQVRGSVRTDTPPSRRRFPSAPRNVPHAAINHPDEMSELLQPTACVVFTVGA